MTHPQIPEAIASAVDALVQPYGLNFNVLLNPQPTTPDLGGPGKKFFSVKEAEEYSSVSRYTLHRAVKAGELVVSKLSSSKNGKVLIPVKELDRWINNKILKNK